MMKFKLVILIPCLVLVFGLSLSNVKTVAAQEVNLTAQIALIQQLLAQIQSLQKLLATMKGGSQSSVSETSRACLSLGTNFGYRASDLFTGGDVSALQDFLQTKGLLNSEPTGFYGLMTVEALKRFQSSYGIEATGYLGGQTRAKIKVLSCETAPVVTPPIACTMDVQMCSDGSFVGRVAPSCRFATCPSSVVTTPTPQITSAQSKEFQGVIYIRLYGKNMKNVVKAYEERLVDGESRLAVASTQSDMVTIEYPHVAAYENRANSRMHIRLIDNKGQYSNWFSMSEARHSPEEETEDDTDPIVTPEITLFSSKDPDPVTGAVTIVWKTSGDATVGLDVECAPGSVSLKTSKGNYPSCEKGGVWTWNDVSSGSIAVTPIGNTQPITLPFILSLYDKNGSFTGERLTEYITFPATNVNAEPEMTNVSFTNVSPGTEANITRLEFKFAIKNWRSGLVLDVEPFVKCDDHYMGGSWCGYYLFDLGQKAGESYQGVSGNPYVKAGAVYRFTGTGTETGETIVIKAYPGPDPSLPDDNQISAFPPDSVTYKFILRDTSTGGEEIWSKEYYVGQKG